MAQDPVKVDPRHYAVEVENDQVRVLRIRYGPHEKSVMHGHPDGVLVCLTGFHARFTFPDGGTEERSAKAGETLFLPGEEHLPENLSDAPLELILVELKSKPVAGKAVDTKLAIRGKTKPVKGKARKAKTAKGKRTKKR